MNSIVVQIKNRRIALNDFLLVVVFSVIYTLAVNILLPETYGTGVFYEKKFSIDILILCIIDALILYAITELTVSKNNYIQSCVIRIIFWVYAIPMSLYPALFNPKYVWQFWINFNMYWFFLCVLTSQEPQIRMINISLSFPASIKRMLGIISIVIIIYYLISQLHDYSFSLSIDNAYGVRQSFKEQMGQNFFAIFKLIFGTYICPCLIVFFIKARKVMYGLLFIILQFVLFSMAKDKIMLVYALTSIIIGTIPEYSLRKTKKIIYYAVLSACLVIFLVIIDVLPVMIFSLVVRRMFTMPAWGNYLWFEFFTDNLRLWLHQDVFFIDRFFSPVYQSSAPVVIANSIGKGEYSYFNCGLMAPAYAQFGVIGCIIGPIVVGFWLNFLNGFYARKSLNVQLMLAFSLAMAIINATVIESLNIFIFFTVALYSGVFLNEK